MFAACKTVERRRIEKRAPHNRHFCRSRHGKFNRARSQTKCLRRAAPAEGKTFHRVVVSNRLVVRNITANLQLHLSVLAAVFALSRFAPARAPGARRRLKFIIRLNGTTLLSRDVLFSFVLFFFFFFNESRRTAN